MVSKSNGLMHLHPSESVSGRASSVLSWGAAVSFRWSFGFLCARLKRDHFVTCSAAESVATRRSLNRLHVIGSRSKRPILMSSDIIVLRG